MKYPRANYPTPADKALAEIIAALFPQGEDGWNAWYTYAAAGEWF